MSRTPLLAQKKLTLLCTITPTSLRKKLKNLRELGVFVPVKGTPLEDRKKKLYFALLLLWQNILKERPLQKQDRS